MAVVDTPPTYQLQTAQPGLQILGEQLEEATLVVPGVVEHQVIQSPLHVLADHLDGLVRGVVQRVQFPWGLDRGSPTVTSMCRVL